VIAILDRDVFLDTLDSAQKLESLLLDDQMLDAINRRDNEPFISRRTETLEQYLRAFLDDRTGEGFEITPPLSEFDFDDDPTVVINGDSG
jgi:hypothetical protein